MTKISIILPCYNEAGHIRSSIENLEGQTFEDRELIIINDGSDDDTLRIARSLINEKHYHDIRLLEALHHLGPTRARNLGLKESQGEVIFFAECDCTYEPHYIEKALGALEASPQAGAVCLTGAPMKTRSTVATESIVIENKAQHLLLEKGKMKPFYAWVFRREVVLALDGFDEKLFQAEDRDLFRRFIQAGYKVAWVPGTHWWHKRDQTLTDLAGKWIARGQTRVAYVLKHRLAFDMLKTLAPFWIFVVGIVLLFVQPFVGILSVLGVLMAVVVRSLRTILTTWNAVEQKRWFLTYPLFVLVRNFSLAIGYSLGLVRIPFQHRSPERIADFKTHELFVESKN
ncbi:MAG: glycosyltransferase [Thaumarchaeota archaeon]|nr:glycosyltransferase [Nitrososphaerota archaeon]